MDDLLAQIQAEFAQKQQSSAASSPETEASELDANLAELRAAATSQPPQPPMSTESSSDPLDNLLAEVKSDFPSPAPPETSGMDALLAEVKSEVAGKASPAELDNPLAQLKAKHQGKAAAPPSNTSLDSQLNGLKAERKSRPVTPPRAASQGMDKLLGELKAEFKQQDLDERLECEQTERREKFLADKRRQRRRAALQKKAEEWLKELDPYSDEGFWFDQFASGYESRLAAAVDYLEALI